MRYAMLDMSKLDHNHKLAVESYLKFSNENIGYVLSEEETMAKFKEVWDAANESTEEHTTYPEDIDRKRIGEDWDRFKEKL